MERTLAEEVNATAEQMGEQVMNKHYIRKQGNRQQVVRKQQDTGQSQETSNAFRQVNGVQYAAVSRSVPKHTTDSNQDL